LGHLTTLTTLPESLNVKSLFAKKIIYKKSKENGKNADSLRRFQFLCVTVVILVVILKNKISFFDLNIMKQKMFLIAAALVLLFTSAFNMKAQVGFNELDPNILWVADSTIGRIDGFAVHPNGNIFAYQGNIINEINGADGKLIRKFNIPNKSISSIDISRDGKYLATAYDGVIITDLITLKSDTVGTGNRATFNSNSNKIAFRLAKGDQSIVILDLNSRERSYIKTEELIHKIAFSPDGRFLATGGSGEDIFGKSYVSLKLWDANTLKLIKELEKMDNVNFNFYRIEFSSNSKLVAYLPYNGELSIFNTESTKLYRKYGMENQTIQGIGKFCFLNDSLITFSSIEPSTLIWNYDKDERAYNIVNFNSTRGIEYSIELDAIILGTTSKLYAYSLNSIMTSVQEDVNQTTINAMYSKGTLIIKGIVSVGNTVNLQIIDINGKLIKDLNLPNTGSEISIPVSLNSGAYIIHLKDGNKEFSSKFLVIE
jgi:WD40 repeat protein